MPATNKTNLIDVTTRDYAKPLKLITDISEHDALCKDAEDTSIKDVIAHRAHWIDLFLGWYADGQAGKEVHFPAPDYKWNQLKEYNAKLRASQSDLGWTAALSELATAHDRLMAFLADLSNDALYGGPMKGARNDWTSGRWAEAAGASHYRSAAKYTRQRLKEVA
jgi:hypothetical protein